MISTDHAAGATELTRRHDVVTRAVECERVGMEEQPTDHKSQDEQDGEPQTSSASERSSPAQAKKREREMEQTGEENAT